MSGSQDFDARIENAREALRRRTGASVVRPDMRAILSAAGLPEALDCIAELEGLLRRLSQWDVLNSTAEGSDAPYWQGEIARVLGNP